MARESSPSDQTVETCFRPRLERVGKIRGSIAKASVCPTTLSTARTTAPSTGATSAGGTGFAELHATATTAHAMIGNNDLW